MIAYIFSKLNAICNGLLHVNQNIASGLYGKGTLGNIYYGVTSEPNAAVDPTYKQILAENGEKVFMDVGLNKSRLKDKTIGTETHPEGQIHALHFLPQGILEYKNLWIGPNTMLAAQSDIVSIFVQDTLTIEKGWLSSNGTYTSSNKLLRPEEIASTIKYNSVVTGAPILEYKDFLAMNGSNCGGNIILYYNNAKVGKTLYDLRTLAALNTYLKVSGSSYTSNNANGGCIILYANNIRIVSDPDIDNFTPSIESLGGDGLSAELSRFGTTNIIKCHSLGD